MVAGRVACSAASGSDTKVGKMGGRGIATTDVLVGASAPHVLSATKGQAITGVDGRSKRIDTHPITKQLGLAVLEDWQAWAADQAKAFQHASSAVEGRSGY